MPSYYCVVQYVPDPTSDERINIGVVTYGQNRIYSRFLRRWSRVRSFGGAKSVVFLRDLASELEDATGAQMPLQLAGAGHIDVKQLERWNGHWLSSVQLTKPRASTLPPDALLDNIVGDFLRESPHPRKRPRGRRTAASLAAKRISAALEERVGAEAGNLLKRNHAVPGALEPHRFDLSLENGTVYFGAQALSFETEDDAALKDEVHLMAWAIADVRSAAPKLPLAVVALPPKRQSEAFTLAKTLTNGLRVELVSEEDLTEWASRLVRELSLAHFAPQLASKSTN